MPRRSRSPWLTLIATLAIATSCGASGDDTGDDTGATGETDAATASTTTVVLTSDGRLRVRPVVTFLPIDGMPLNPFGDDDPAEPIVSPNIDSTVAYDLGPAVADDGDVTEAVAGPGQAGEWSVTVTLSAAATDDVRALAQACLDLAPGCERGQIAVTVDGFVVTALPVTDTRVGPSLVLSGGLNERQATVIAEALAG